MERENSISCETQLEYCKAAIKPHERDEQVLIFVDNGFSGGNTDREGFQSMMRLVRQNRVSKVVVYKLDRISRSLADFVNILQEFKTHQVKFVSSQESFDTDSPYGELIVKILMVFAEFERASAISRVTQAYAHRSELGLYMGGRRPYGFELVPAVLHNVKTKVLSPLPEEARQIRLLFALYARECGSLGQLRDRLLEQNERPMDGSAWTTAKLSTILRNPIYVGADADVYDYFERRGVRIVGELARFTGEFGAQLYGHSGSDSWLVLLTHRGLVDSATWLQCQRKLDRNRKLTASCGNPTSWLAGLVYCEQCGSVMTTVKGRPDRNGEQRRYFCCTGKTNKKICNGPETSVYIGDLEQFIQKCVSEKLSAAGNCTSRPEGASAERNRLKLRLKAIEQAERQLLDCLSKDGMGEDLLRLTNARAAELWQEREAVTRKLEALKQPDSHDYTPDLSVLWNAAEYRRRKAAAALLMQRISIAKDGGVTVFWRI